MVFGMYRAPLLKALVAGTLIGGFLPPKVQSVLGIKDVDAVLRGGEAWRLFSSPSVIAFESVSSLISCVVLLYSMRTFERQMGTSKFTVFVILSYLWAIGTRAVTCLIPLGGIASGPYELLFALFVYYYTSIPKLTPNYFSVFGIKFSDKSLLYMLGLQLMLSSGFRSVVPAAFGLVFGILYMKNVGFMQRITFPRSIRTLCGALINSWWEAEPSYAAEERRMRAAAAREAALRAQEDAEIQQLMAQAGQYPMQTNAARTRPVSATRAAAFTVDEGALQRLMAMGFGRQESVAALTATNNDETAAANQLLEN